MAGVGAIEFMDLDVCIPGTPKWFKDGCFTEGTLVLTQTGRMPIEQLSIGRRVITGPEGSPQPLQPFLDITQWRVLKLEYVRPDTQQVLHMAFLRSAAEADLLSPGDTTPILIEEMGIEGQARVIAVEPCPPLEQGEGELITATFMQEHIDVRLLKLEGLAEPIEVTGSHPVYSEDQHTFVPVKELGRGERLRTRIGTAVVESILRKHGSWRVYNLEIGTVHRYYVSQLDVLVHNSCSTLKSNMLKAGQTFEEGEQAAHIVPKNIASRNTIVQKSIDVARRVLEDYGLLDDAANGFKAPAGHLGTHTNAFLETLGDLLKEAGGKSNKAVVQALSELRGRILAGEWS
jgi:hypothetical protein